MKPSGLVPVVILLGVTVLFFFPKPQTNFFAYAATALLFIALIIFLTIWQKKH